MSNVTERVDETTNKFLEIVGLNDVVLQPTLLDPSLETDANFTITSMLSQKMNQLSRELKILETANLGNSRNYQSAIDQCKLTCMDFATAMIKILTKTNNKLTRQQMILYYKWIKAANTLAMHEVLATEGTAIGALIMEQLPKLMLTNQNPLSVEQLLSKINETDEAFSLEAWRFYPKQTFNDFVGRENIIKELKSLTLLMPFVEKYRMICFTGPPGTGKTKFAEAIMSHFEAECYLLNITELLSAYLGRTESTLKKLFLHVSNPINANKRFVIFFDEADEIFKSQTEQSMQNVSLTIQLALEGNYPLNNNVIIIAATNYKNTIKAPILDRISMFQYIDVPTTEDIIRFFIHKCGITSPEGKYYYSQTLIPLIVALPHQITFRNLNNLYDSAKNFHLKENMLDSLETSNVADENIYIYFEPIRQNFEFQGNRSIKMLYSSEKVNSVEDKMLNEVTTFMGELEKINILESTILQLQNNQRIKMNLMTFKLISTVCIFYYRPSLENFKMAKNNVNIMSPEVYLRFAEINDSNYNKNDSKYSDLTFSFDKKSNQEKNKILHSWII